MIWLKMLLKESHLYAIILLNMEEILTGIFINIFLTVSSKVFSIYLSKNNPLVLFVDSLEYMLWDNQLVRTLLLVLY